MKQLNILFLILCLLSMQSCSSDPEEVFNQDKNLPELKSLSEMEQTNFITTLEVGNAQNSNSIYSASFCMAWDKLKEIFPEGITDVENDELALIHNSDLHKDVLDQSEFFATIEAIPQGVKVRSFFKKSLPLLEPMARKEKPLLFAKKEVASFGFQGSHKSAKILYYNNDRDFALKLIPEDDEHEIIIATWNKGSKNKIDHDVQTILDQETQFKNNRNNKNDWMYYFNDKDKVQIPIIEFHLETFFPEKYTGTTFNCNEILYKIDETYQRTAFVLNENGAEIESEASIAVKEADERIQPPVKNLIFDMPFIVFLKRKDSELQYFSVFVMDGELLKEFD